VTAPAIASGQAWCTFQLAGGDYGVELARVQEVLRAQPVTRLPHAPAAIAGLMNLRGRIVPVVDTRRVLGIDGARAGDVARRSGLVIVRSADGPVALLVDAIGDVRRAEDAAPSLPAAESPLVARTLALPGQLLVVLDLDRVLERAFAAPEVTPPSVTPTTTVTSPTRADGSRS
jgi:purine-binding chemotaxis protein CheW